MNKGQQTLILFAILPLSLIINGCCFLLMWGWFVVPLGVAPVGLAQAAGLLMLVGFLKFKSSDESRQVEFGLRVLNTLFIGPLVTLISFPIHVMM